MPKDAPTKEGRAAVARAVSGRMGELRVSPAELRRRSGLSINTIRGITEKTGRPNKATLVAMSAVLDWPWDYLVNILAGRPDLNVAAESPLEPYLARLAAVLTEMNLLRQDIAGLKEAIHEIGERVDVVIRSRHDD